MTGHWLKLDVNGEFYSYVKVYSEQQKHIITAMLNMFKEYKVNLTVFDGEVNNSDYNAWFDYKRNANGCKDVSTKIVNRIESARLICIGKYQMDDDILNFFCVNGNISSGKISDLVNDSKSCSCNKCSIVITDEMLYAIKLKNEYWIKKKNGEIPPDNPNGKFLCDMKPDLYAQLYIKKNLDEGINIDNIACYSNRYVWWFCVNSKCGHHVWKDTPAHRSRRGSICSFCNIRGSSEAQNVCICDSIYVNIEVMKDWDWERNNKIGLDPRKISCGSKVKAWWKCTTHKTCDNHRYFSPIRHKISRKIICTFCTHRHGCVCICDSIFTKRTDIMLMWDWEKNNEIGLDPKTIPLYSNIYAWWRCGRNHSFYAQVARVILQNACSSCNKYVNEEYCRDLIEKITGYSFMKQRPEWLYGLELDGYSEKNKVAFEYNGIQHYEIVPHFHTRGKIDLDEGMYRDRRKIQICKQNNVKLIIIPYWIESDKL